MRTLNSWKAIFAVSALCASTAICAPAQAFTSLFSFDSTNGSNPYAGLVQGTNGKLYGTTTGTIFRMTTGGALTTLLTFDGVNGDNSVAGLALGTDGNFYGTTDNGGATGWGTVFKITASGVLTTLHSFCSESGCADGANPYAVLVQGTDGNFYGTTDGGGAYGNGTVFKISRTGTLTTLYSFCSQSGCADGAQPSAGLVQATDGNFYGTTSYGGANLYYGTVFKITPTGTLTTLYNFCSLSGCADGADPEAALVQGTDGNFYGTTFSGGTGVVDCSGGCGTVFQMTASGVLSILHRFCVVSGCPDGAQPQAPLIQATDGKLYGTTDSFGANRDYGTVFRITTSGALKTLHSFDGEDGQYPYAPLVQDTNGKFYGTTQYGGANDTCTFGCGTVFELSTGLGPFVRTVPAVGETGNSVIILGTSLTGATSVTFNGTAATFTVESASYIKTTVPAGATTGAVQVVTPGGTLTSNVNFQVEP